MVEHILLSYSHLHHLPRPRLIFVIRIDEKILILDMSLTHDERQRELLDVDSHQEQISPLSNRFLVAHSSPVHEPANPDIPSRLPDDSFQSSSSTSNSKSSSSTHSHTSRFQFLMIQHHSAVNSPLAYSRCTSLGSLSSFDIRSSYNDSYTSECSSIKPSGMISPSDMPDSPPCEPEILDDEEHKQQIKPNNRTLTMNTTSSLNRTTMMGETVIEKTFIFNQHELISNHKNDNIQEEQEDEDDDGEHLDEVIVYTYETPEMTANQYSNEILFDDDSYRVFSSQTDDHDDSIEEQKPNDSSFNVPSHENLSVITEESSFIEEIHSNDENNSIKILYDLIKKPHWTNKTSLPKPSHYPARKFHAIEENASFSSNPSSLSFDSHDGLGTDDDEEYDQEKGRQLIQRLIEETLVRR